MTQTQFKKVSQQVLVAVAQANGLNLNAAKVGGDLEYAQEITGRAMLTLAEQIVQESLKPRTRVATEG